MDLSKYYEAICKIPILTPSEERELIAVYFSEESSDKDKARAREKIISSNLRFPFKQAKELAKTAPEQFEDLIAAGNEGLTIALDKYDPTTPHRFLTYAGWWVFQRQQDTLAGYRMVRLPIWKQQLAQRICKAIDASQTPLTVEDLKTLFPEAAEKDLKELSTTKYLTYYFEDLPEEDSVCDRFENEVERAIESNRLDEAIDSLPALTKKVIELCFGFDDGEVKKLSAVARIMKMSLDDVKAHRREGIRILRSQYQVDLLPD